LVGFLARAVKSGQTQENESSHAEYLDARILNTPTIAMLQVKNEIVRMADITAAMYDDIIHLYYRFDAKSARRVMEVEDMIDALHRQISNFIVLLSRRNLDPENAMRVPVLLQLVNELEQLADLNMKLLEALQRKKHEKVSFSIHAMTDLKRLAASVGDVVALAKMAIDVPAETAARLPGLLQTVDDIRESAIAGHVKRMKSGHCSVEAGILFNDMVSTLTDISTCAANIITTGEPLR
jgi:phosphate:Na+ symporter